MFETLLAAISAIAIIIGWLIAIFGAIWKVSSKLQLMDDRLKDLGEKDIEIIEKVSSLNLNHKRQAKRISRMEVFLTRRFRNFIRYDAKPEDLD